MSEESTQSLKEVRKYNDGTQMREYFEQGCLCIVYGDLEVQIGMSNWDAVEYYMDNCNCSRHPESGRQAKAKGVPEYFAYTYKCNACDKEYIRESQKKWMPSYCDTMDKPARLYRGR